MRTAASLLCLLLGAAGCGPRAQRHALEPPAGDGRAIDGATGQPTKLPALLNDLAQADAVYVGERHNNAEHHDVQLQILRALAKRHPHLGLGLEMFSATQQDDLDRYLADEIGEPALLRRTKWRTQWGHPWSLYAELVRFARDESIPVIALNAPRELSRAVSRRGLDGLTEAERAQLPDMDLGNEAHRAYVRSAFERHDLPEDRFEGFYAAQVLWDETMAHHAAEYILNGGDHKRPILVLAGIGHVAGGMGIPSRVERRTGSTGRIVIPVKASELERHLEQQTADWLWVTKT